MLNLLKVIQNANYTIMTQMVDIYLLSLYLLATYQPFALS